MRTYKLGMIGNEEQEAVINSILCEVTGKEMYALDWHHDCFLFNTIERIRIPTGVEYYDAARNCKYESLSFCINRVWMFFMMKVAIYKELN